MATIETIDSRKLHAANQRLNLRGGSNPAIELRTPIRDGMPHMIAERMTLSKVIVLRNHVTESWGYRRTPVPYVSLLMPLRGGVRSLVGSRRELRAQPGEAMVNRPNETILSDIESGSGLALFLPTPDELLKRAEVMTDFSYNRLATYELTDHFDASTGVAAALRRRIIHAFDEVHELQNAGASQLATFGIEETILNLSCAILFPAVMKTCLEPPRPCSARTVDNIRQYMRANAHERIDIAETARRFGINLRTLQHNFLARYGVSAREYLMQCRLENARARLSDPHGLTSVIAVAGDCGFSSPSHFTQAYRAHYGETPSETLARMRRIRTLSRG